MEIIDVNLIKLLIKRYKKIIEKGENDV